MATDLSNSAGLINVSDNHGHRFPAAVRAPLWHCQFREARIIVRIGFVDDTYDRPTCARRTPLGLCRLPLQPRESLTLRAHWWRASTRARTSLTNASSESPC